MVKTEREANEGSSGKIEGKAREKLEGENKWDLHEFDRGVREAKKLPGLKEYVETLEGIAALLETATRELAKRAKKGEVRKVVEIHGKLYSVYGPVELPAWAEHVERGGKRHVVIEIKHGDRTARGELEIEKYWRSAFLTNLAAITTADARDFYKGYDIHASLDYSRLVERLATWGLFMPGKYEIEIDYYATEEDMSPVFSIMSDFSITKIENSPIHRLVLRLARELAGRENLREMENATNYILAASWLLASAILNTPDGGRPSKGLAVLAEKGVVPNVAFDRLKPIFEELDALLGPISRVDKAHIVGKIVDYRGAVIDGHLLVKAKEIKRIIVEFGGVEIRMTDVAEAAAKAFSKEGGLFDDVLSFGLVEDIPELKVVPAFKAIAALAQEGLKEADRRRQEGPVEYGQPIIYKGGGAEVEIRPAEAEEVVPITPENLEEIWKGFESGKYTHLRLVIDGKVYDLRVVRPKKSRRTKSSANRRASRRS